MVPPPTHPESPSMGAATSTASSTLLFSKARTFFETYCLNLAVIGHLVLWVCGETPTLGFGATDSGRSDATTSSSSQEEAAEEDAARLLEQELVMAFEQQRAAEMEWFSDERRAEGFTAQAVVWARKAAEEAVKRQREEEQRRVEEAARVVREREEMQKRLRANARTRATRDGVHEGTFCDLAGNPNSVTLYKEKKDRWSSYAQRWRSCTPPTVREWRQVLANQVASRSFYEEEIVALRLSNAALRSRIGVLEEALGDGDGLCGGDSVAQRQAGSKRAGAAATDPSASEDKDNEEEPPAKRAKDRRRSRRIPSWPEVK